MPKFFSILFFNNYIYYLYIKLYKQKPAKMSYARMVQLDEECKHLQIMANNNISGSRLFNARLCGAIWRTGDAPHEDGSPNTQGHWVAASHIPSTRD